MQDERIQFVNYYIRDPEVLATQHHKINEIFELYKAIWVPENEDLYNNKNAESLVDRFYINDTAQCLYIDGKLAAFNLARHASLDITHHRQQCWLSCWPAEILEQIQAAYGTDVIIGNHLTVAPEHRRTSVANSNIAVTFAMLISMQIVESDQTYLGEMRTSRSVQQIGKIAGAITLREGHSVYGVDADLVVFPGKGISDTVDRYPNEIRDLYQKAVSYGPRTFANTDRLANLRDQASS